MAVELVREEGDLAGAAGVLEAAGCSCPTGNLGEGVWDERGVGYGLPRWVVANPVDIKDEEEEVSEEKQAGEDNDEAAVEMGVDSEEKGKARMGVDTYKVKVRLSDRGTDILAEMVQGQSVKALIRRVQEELEVSSSRGACTSSLPMTALRTDDAYRPLETRESRLHIWARS